MTSSAVGADMTSGRSLFDGTEETRSDALSLEARLGRGPRTCAAAGSEERMARILPAPKLLVRLRAQQQLLITCDSTAGNVIRRYSHAA